MACNIPSERRAMFEEKFRPTVEAARKKIKEAILSMRSAAPIAGTTRSQRAQAQLAQLEDVENMNEVLRQVDLRIDEIVESLYMQLNKDIDSEVNKRLKTAAASSSE